MIQGELFDGRQLRDQGIERAITHANEVHANWSDDAFYFLLRFLKTQNGEFMTEHVRAHSQGIIPDPPSKRAWGGVMIKAKKDGIIKSVGHRKVTNSKAHCAFATVWISA